MSRKKQPRQPDKPPNGPPARPMSREEFLKMAFAAVQEKLSAAGRQNLQANFELQYDYPNEWVVFIDDWVGEGRNRRLQRRLLIHSPELFPTSELVAKLPPEDLKRINWVFVDDPFSNEIRL